MPFRKTVLAPGETYHIFNRGVAKLPIFFNHYDFSRFIDLMDYYRFSNTPISFSHFKKLDIKQRREILNLLCKENKRHVEIIAFCLMSNHFHFLLKQITEKGISKFISNLQNGYAKYINIKTERTGPLLEPMFKAVRIESEEQLIHVSRYIHLNPSTGYLVSINNLESYPWSSLLCYLEREYSRYPFVNTLFITGLIKENIYKNFVYDQAAYQRELNKIKHLTFE